MNRSTESTTRRGFLKAGAGAIAATTMTETTLAYGHGDGETPVVIKRDEYGVAHVYARDTTDRAPAYFGYGYAVAEDRLYQLELYRRFYRGTVANVLGSEWVEFDRQARISFNRPETDLDEQVEAHLGDEYRAILEAYADGINEYIDTVESGDRDFHKGFVDNDFTPERWDRTDVAGVWVAVARFFSSQAETAGAFVLSQLQEVYGENTGRDLFSDVQWGDDPGSPTSIGRAVGYTPPYTRAGDDVEEREDSEGPPDDRGRARGSSDSDRGRGRTSPPAGEYRLPADPEAAHESAMAHRRTLAEGLDSLGLPIKIGSNGLAVGPDHTESGDALLFGGPQLGFSSPSTAYEVGLHGKHFDVVGTAIPGLPIVFFGHNRNGAFTATAGLDNTIQTFVETIREDPDGDGYQYKVEDEWRPVRETTEPIPVTGGDDDEVTIRNTRHGVVIDWRPDAGEAVTMTRSYEGRDLIDVARAFDYPFAGDVDEFIEAFQGFNYSFNGLWADVNGDIGFVHSGRVPDWESVPWDTRLPADGTRFELTDGDYLYAGNGEMPSETNPDKGYFTNWNNKPAPGWNNGDLSFFWGSDGRVQRIINLVDNRLDEVGTISYEFMKEIVYDTSFVDLAAIRYKEPLLDALDGESLSETEEAARNALAEWNDFRQGAGEDSFGPYPVGFTVFSTFFPKLLEQTFKPTFGPLYPALVPLLDSNTGGSSLLLRALHPEEAALDPAVDYFDGNQEGVFRSAFTDAVADLENQFETDDVSKWRVPAAVEELDNLSLFGMPIGVGDPGDMPLLNRGTQNHFVQLGGDERGSGPGFRAENVVPPGNSGYIAPDGTKDEHYADQLQMFIDFEYKQLRFADDEVASGTDSVTTLRNDD